MGLANEGYDTLYRWPIHNFESLKEIVKKREIFDVKSRSFQTVQRDFRIVVYSRGNSCYKLRLRLFGRKLLFEFLLANLFVVVQGYLIKATSAFVFEPEDPYPSFDQLLFSVVTRV